MTTPQHTSSYYAASANDKNIRPSLVGEISSDICIIGAGYTGLSTAIHLAESGFKVTVLEGSRVGFGASGRNGGQIVHSYSRDIDFIEKHYGKETGKAMGAMAFEGGRIIRNLVDKYNINCDLKDGGIFASCTAKQLKELEGKKALWESHGHTQLEMLDATTIKNHVGSDRYTGGLLDKSGGHFHPLNLVQGEAEALESLGGVIYEDSQVVRVEEGETVTVHTKTGCGAREPSKIESKIVPNLLKTFPELKGVKIDYAWTGNFLLTLMRLPQIGRIGKNIYYSQGYSGHGLTCTHLAGKVLSDAIQGQAERYDVFASLPQYPFPGGRTLRVPLTALGAAYYNLRDKLGF